MRTRRAVRLGWLGWLGIALLALVVIATNGPRLHLLGSQALADIPASGGNGEIGAVLLSGDMGLKVGISAATAQGLAASGYRVTAVSTPVAFARHLSRAEADGVVVKAIDAALAKGARKVVLVGQSFGSEIIATVLPDLPERLRSKLAAVAIVVPSNNVFFRADPSGVAYLGQPDAHPADALRTVDWVPLTCIQGTEERSSLCPLLAGSPARRIVLPGNHYLHRDTRLILATLIGAIRQR